MTTPNILGTLVAIPIKGRKLLNRTGSKQSPYVQLKLGEQKKRTKASLIASADPEWDHEVRLEVHPGQLNMLVSVYDDGKKNELIGEGNLLLHEVIDKGELDVWFPIKLDGTSAGEIYFELTFYALVSAQEGRNPQLENPPSLLHFRRLACQ
ncbi:MAG: C2 domain-containing protein [Benniella sp.]|nr:MAG: C2 domain-containing protein [Benniella sp.]